MAEPKTTECENCGRISNCALNLTYDTGFKTLINNYDVWFCCGRCLVKWTAEKYL